MHRSWSKLQRSVNIFIQKEQHNCRLWKSSIGTSNSRLLFSSSRIRHLDHQRKWHTISSYKKMCTELQCKKILIYKNLSLARKLFIQEVYLLCTTSTRTSWHSSSLNPFYIQNHSNHLMQNSRSIVSDL